MPTPVSVARQCLTEEAARVLDDAVSVARRRSHAQTTSLHTISALLGLPSSILRDACARSRTIACSSRLQFRALELCVGVSLDRLPSTKTIEDEPPVSNSLMAAIKRSQANQRRHPPDVHLQQMHYSDPQTPSALKVELKHFVLSILDDPIVSRVFGEAGFRSVDIKLAVIRPPPKLSRPPLFLYSPTGSDPGRPGFNFPFAGLEDEGDENCRRICEVLVKKTKNPLLVGVCASDALKRFVEFVNKGKEVVGQFLPGELSGLTVISIEDEVVKFVNEGGKDEEKIEELLGCVMERCSGRSGVVVSFGGVEVLVGQNVCGDAVSSLASKLAGLLERFRENLWLIGAAASFEIYSKFKERFPDIEKDWDLQFLPITSSSRSTTPSFASKSSLIGSFVPFGGFFSAPTDFRTPAVSINQPITLCHLCAAKYEQEVAAVLKTGTTISVADQYSDKLPSWLQMAELDKGNGVDVVAKTDDDKIAWSSKLLGLQKKWNDICQRLHHVPPYSRFNISQTSSQVPIAEGFRSVSDKRESTSCSSRDSSLNETQFASVGLGVCMDPQKIFPENDSRTTQVLSEAENLEYKPKLWEKETQHSKKDGPWFIHYSIANSNLLTDCTLSSSVTSVTTDLGLGTLYASGTREPTAAKLHAKDHLQNASVSNSVEIDVVSETTSRHIAQYASCSNPPPERKLDLIDYKSIRKVLAKNVCWQDEATCIISEAVSRYKAGYRRCQGSTARGDIWLTFLGPDKMGKRRIASALAEIMLGDRENLVSVDVSSHDKASPSSLIFECQRLSEYDQKFRGKTVADYISTELIKKPHAVIFLENVDKADILVQTSLSHAVRTGKFRDSHGREISINNRIFLMTSILTMGDKSSQLEESNQFCEVRILQAKNWQIRLVIKQVADGSQTSNQINARVSRKIPSTDSSVNKRKIVEVDDCTEYEMNSKAKKHANKILRSYLDLNVPVEEVEENAGYDSDSISENSEAWLEDFFDQVDKKVVFKPFDFDSLAEKIVNEISIQLQRIFGHEALLEIDDEVMVQMLAASWLSDKKNAMEDWVAKVLSKWFSEARQKYHLGGQCVVQLITCEGLLVEDHASGIYLPAKITL